MATDIAVAVVSPAQREVPEAFLAFAEMDFWSRCRLFLSRWGREMRRKIVMTW